MIPKNSISLGRVFGIPVVLSQFLGLMVVFVVFMASLNGFSPPLVLLFVTILMGLVLLHELGHSLTARHFGVKVSHITLWPLGGVAWMDELPRDARIEGLVAIAGPAVNLALAALAAPLMFFGPLAQPVTTFIAVNLMLGLFNLLPAFPMDGGRILRAYLARKGDWLAATERAVSIGAGFSFLIGVAGLFTGNLFLPFIAVYLWFAGKRELFSMRAREMGPGWPFAGFAGAGQNPGGPFGPGSNAGQAPWSEEEPSAPRTPQPTPESQPRRQGQGFSEADIDRLENFHGRLKRDWRAEE